MISHDRKMATKRSLGNLCSSKTLFFLCDIQERFRPVIYHFNDIVAVAKRMITASEILNIPLIVTEQYPSGLGKTVPELPVGHAVGVFPKTKFSMMIPEVVEKINSLGGHEKFDSVVLFGIEAHVCIQQTTLDLIDAGFDVHVVADAVSSRSQMDRMFAFERLRQAGAIVTTSESTLLQLVADKAHPQFKPIQGLIKDSAPVSFPQYKL